MVLVFLYFEVDGAPQQPHYSVNIKCPMNAQQTAVKPSTNCISYELLIRLMRRLVMDALQFYIVYNPLSSSFYCHCCCCLSQHACLRTNFIQCVLNNNLRIVINKTWPLFFLWIYLAFVSWVRFYSAFPKDMKQIFNRKSVHMGHYAKSLGLREPPSSFSAKFSQPKPEKPHNRLTYAHKE